MKFSRLILAMFITCTTLWSTDIPVTSLSDSGAGSFREALSAAQNNDTITFDTALSGTMTLLSQLPSIDKSIQIYGPPSGLVTVSGNAVYPVFQVDTGDIEIHDLHVSYGDTTDSGAGLFIGDLATVHFFNGSFANCTATGAEGGAVHLGKKATFDCEDTTFTNNSSGGPGNDVFFSVDSTMNYSCQVAIGAIEIFGTGMLKKSGSGTATFTAASSSDIALVAFEGETICSGTRTGATGVYSKLIASGTINDLINYGTLKPTETIGTLETGFFYQDYDGTLEIAITPTTGDIINATNTALQGTLHIIPAAGTYTIGTVYTILTSEKEIITDFRIVSSTSMTFEQHCYADRVDIEITGL